MLIISSIINKQCLMLNETSQSIIKLVGDFF